MDGGWIPASIGYLLAFGEQYPNEQCYYPIPALGTVEPVRRIPSVPYLSQSGPGRILGLRYVSDGWDDNCRFLAVKKAKKAGTDLLSD